MFNIINANELEIVIMKNKKWINYTKLCKNLGKNFVNIVNTNNKFSKLVRTYEDITYDFNIENLIKNNILCNYKGIENEFTGIYGPRYMLEFIVITCDITYYKSIIEAVDSYKDVYTRDYTDDYANDKIVSQFNKFIDSQLSVFGNKINEYFDILDKSYSSVYNSIAKFLDEFNNYNLILYKNEDNKINLFIGLSSELPTINNRKILLNFKSKYSLNNYKRFLNNIVDKNILNLQLSIKIIEFNTKINAEITLKNCSVNKFAKRFKIKLLNIINNKSDSIKEYYNIQSNVYEKIIKGDYKYKYKNRWRIIKIDYIENKLYVNYGKNDINKYYLEYDEIY